MGSMHITDQRFITVTIVKNEVSARHCIHIGYSPRLSKTGEAQRQKALAECQQYIAQLAAEEHWPAFDNNAALSIDEYDSKNVAAQINLLLGDDEPEMYVHLVDKTQSAVAAALSATLNLLNALCGKTRSMQCA